jgi:hypothetical protein
MYAWTLKHTMASNYSCTGGNSRWLTFVQEEILDGLHRRSDGETVAAR